MQKYTLYLGLNDKDTKKQEIATLEAYKITTKTLRIETIRSTDEGAILRVNHEEYYIDL